MSNGNGVAATLSDAAESGKEKAAEIGGAVASTASGAVATVKQAAKNLSLSRSVAVRDSVIGYAREKGITLDASQFAVVGVHLTT